MKKKVIIVSIFFVVCTALFIAVRSVDGKVCLQNLVSVNGKAKKTGIYLCFDGGRIDKDIDRYGSLSSREKSVLELIELTSEPETLISKNKVDLSGIETGNASVYIKALHDMWGEISNQRFLFYADHNRLRKFVFSATHRGKRLLIQVEKTLNDNRLRVIRSSNEFSKLLAHWHVYASQFSDDELQLPFWDRLLVFVKYKKVCPDDNYCVFYKKFEFADKDDNSLGMGVWNDFVSRLASDKVSKLLGAMDSGSKKNLGLDLLMTEIPNSVAAFTKWLGAKEPVAFLYGDGFLISFIVENAQKENIKNSYLKGGALPIFFFEDDKTNEYIATELNKINILHKFFKKVDFSGESDRSPSL